MEFRLKRRISLDHITQGLSYEEVEKISSHLLSRVNGRHPVVGIICGTGLGGLAEILKDPISFEYKDIPNFPVSTVAGHKGRLVFGTLGGVFTVCMQGRFHPYEGYPLWKCAMPVRVMKLLGIRTLIVTNAAGGLNHDWAVGDVMMIRDHIFMPGLAGDSPLRGPNDERWGPRFPPMVDIYSPKLRNLVRQLAPSVGLERHLREGVYVQVGGPAYESVAESRALRMLGGDTVGMSTAHEVVTAKHCGLDVVGLSLVTNLVVLEPGSEPPSHQEVLDVGEKRREAMEALVTRLVAALGSA